MSRYYTRVCNFYYGAISKYLVREKKTLPLNGNSNISFDNVEIISRNFKKRTSLKNLKYLPKNINKRVKKDLKLITKKKNLQI